MTHSPATEDTLEPFACLSPFGLDAPMPEGVRVIDPTRAASADFIASLRELDATVFGARRRAAPAWVLYDCGLAPGAVVGLVDGARPVSMLVVIPAAAPGVHLAHTLGADAPDPVARATLLASTWELGRRLLGLSDVLFIEPWSGEVLPVLLASVGALRVEVAFSPAHDTPRTATVRWDGGQPPGGPRTLVRDEAGLRALQAALDAGDEAWLLGIEPAAGELGVSAELSIRRGQGGAR